MPNRLDKFVRDENIKYFSGEIEIETETDPVRLALLKTLLKQEQARVVRVDPKRLG